MSAYTVYTTVYYYVYYYYLHIQNSTFVCVCIYTVQYTVRTVYKIRCKIMHPPTHPTRIQYCELFLDVNSIGIPYIKSPLETVGFDFYSLFIVAAVLLCNKYIRHRNVFACFFICPIFYIYFIHCNIL